MSAMSDGASHQAVLGPKPNKIETYSEDLVHDSQLRCTGHAVLGMVIYVVLENSDDQPFRLFRYEQGSFCLFRGLMQDAVWGPLFCQTTMDRFLTLLGDPQI